MNYKVDPDNVTNFNLTEDQLQLNILFWICAAGKNGHTSAKCLCNLLNKFSILNNEISPFNIILKIKDLPLELKNHGIGCYNNKSKTIKELINKNLNLEKCSIDDLESIWGMGSKTTRCFLMHTRKDQRLAGLDRHVLRFLQEMGHKVPKNSPNKKQYRELEKIFIKIADELNKTPSELDLEIWKKKRILPKTLEKIS
jgi:thermostable 8-oxoguanine DNA glycosylase